jgi:hypothetical protein
MEVRGRGQKKHTETKFKNETICSIKGCFLK